MFTTQDYLKISDIKNGLVFLKDGGVSLVLSVSAINFGLLSEDEQIAIIYSFAGLLNSLSFPIQILIRSERLDVTNYLKNLDKAYYQQKNPLLSAMIQRYRQFVTSVIKENEVLDKQFYICINLTSVEVGLWPTDVAGKLSKSLAMLIPRRDQLFRQLSRVGLKARQLTDEQLIKLFYEIYNNPQEPEPLVQPLPVAQPITVQAGPKPQVPLPIKRLPIQPPLNQLSQNPIPPKTWMPTATQIPVGYSPTYTSRKLSSPYVVEELSE